MNREVNLTKRVRTERGTRYCPVAFSANGRVKPDIVLVDDKPEHHAEGSYYLEWYAGAKRVRLSVGKNAADANARRLRKEAELNALNNGVRVVPEKGTGQRSLAGAVALYLADVKLTHKPRSYAAYNTALQYFLESCHKLNVEDVERRDLLRFSAFLRDERLNKKRVTVRFEKENLTFSADTSDAMATLMLQLLGSFAQFERSLIRERQKEGIALAKQRGAYTGRKRALSAEQAAQLKTRAAAGESKSALAEQF